MKALKTVGLIVLVLIICVIAVFGYYGGFKSIDVIITKQGGETVIYKDVTGDYSQTPDVTNEVYEALLNDYKIETTKGVGIFYDNPQKVEKSKLRSRIGCILDSDVDSLTLAKISEKYNVMVLPKAKYIATDFPMKGGLSMLVGIIKAYPALNKYIEDNNIKEDGPVTEIYDVPGKKVIYRKELADK